MGIINQLYKKMTKKAGRPAYEPNKKDRDKVIKYARIGTPQDDISRIVGINKTTLLKYYKDELELSSLEATSEVADSLYRMTKTIPAAAMFWMKTRAGWKEREQPQEEQKPIKIIFERGETRKSQLAEDEEKKSDAA